MKFALLIAVVALVIVGGLYGDQLTDGTFGSGGDISFPVVESAGNLTGAIGKGMGSFGKSLGN